jgi:hypothetical protein
MTRSPRLVARAYPPALRAAAVALLALAVLCVLDMGGGLLLDIVSPGELERVTLPLMFQRLVWFALAPWLVYLALRWIARAEVEVGETSVTIAGRRTSWEIPRAAVTEVTPWRLPWPGPGITVRLASGRAMSLAMPDPTPLVAELGGAVDDPRLVAARAARATRWLRHPLHTVVLAPLVPTAILFRLHQIIMYGGWLGELQWYGLARWLDTLFGVWLSTAGAMLCWYAGCRLAAALVAWPAAHLAEPRARALRWAIEGVAFIGYYGGVAWLLWSRLAA